MTTTTDSDGRSELAGTNDELFSGETPDEEASATPLALAADPKGTDRQTVGERREKAFGES